MRGKGTPAFFGGGTPGFSLFAAVNVLRIAFLDSGNNRPRFGVIRIKTQRAVELFEGLFPLAQIQ